MTPVPDRVDSWARFETRLWLWLIGVAGFGLAMLWLFRYNPYALVLGPYAVAAVVTGILMPDNRREAGLQMVLAAAFSGLGASILLFVAHQSRLFELSAVTILFGLPALVALAVSRGPASLTRYMANATAATTTYAGTGKTTGM